MYNHSDERTHTHVVSTHVTISTTWMLTVYFSLAHIVSFLVNFAMKVFPPPEKNPVCNPGTGPGSPDPFLHEPWGLGTRLSITYGAGYFYRENFHQ